MPWLKFKTKKFLYDLVPVLFALVVAILYFLSVVPNTRPFWQKYVLTVLGLLILDRIIITWYARHRIMPSIIAYKRGKRAGRVFTRAELEEFYRDFAAHVPKSQIMTSVSWVIAATALATISYLWIQRSWIVFFGILFTGIIAAAISLGFAYFLLKSQIRPLIEEVAASLDRLPDVSDARLSFILKIGASVIGIALVAFLSFGVVFVASIQWLRTKRYWWDALAISSAEVGIVFTTTALLSGSIWAKPTWGTWWTWDPRLTTTLILWLIYVSYMMLRSVVENPSRRASLSAVVGIIGFIDVPVVFMSIRWWRTIHPVVITGSSINLAPTMIVTLVVCLVAFTIFFVHLLQLRLRLELQREDVYQLRELVLYEE
jgi:heme exporter protein C